MDKIEQRYLVKASVGKVWDALVNPKTIAKWGGGPAVMSNEVGFEFSLWGGDVYGKNIEVEKGKRLVQEWYTGEWEAPSIVSFTLSNDGRYTEVILLHVDIPKEEMDDIDEGWRDYYMGPIQRLLDKES